MSGYIILNSKGDRLTQGKWFGAGNGWVWSEEEKNEILANCANWQCKPFAIQEARLSQDGSGVEVIGQPIMVELLKEEAAQQHAHPDGKWKCRACKSVWDGSQLVLDPMSTEVKWTCGDYFCGGSCDRIVIGE